jgi:predicted TIM-barrel fold metal-dependent hydrolase
VGIALIQALAYSDPPGVDDAATWFDAAAIGEADRERIRRGNAVRLFKLKLR